MINKYTVKWYLLWDGLTRRCTDGTLVRLTAFRPTGREYRVGGPFVAVFCAGDRPDTAQVYSALMRWAVAEGMNPVQRRVVSADRVRRSRP